MKKIIFRSYNRRGSAVNRGQDISTQLNTIGYDSEFIAAGYNDLAINQYWNTLHNSIVVFIKTYSSNEIEILKRNNNIVILDIVDSVANYDYSVESVHTIPWDGIITPTMQMIDIIANTNKSINTVSIPHH